MTELSNAALLAAADRADEWPEGHASRWGRDALGGWATYDEAIAYGSFG